MAWLFSFWHDWHQARITNRAVIAKKNPTSSDAQLECWMTKTALEGAADLLHPFSSHGDVGETFSSCSRAQLKLTMKSPAGIQRLTTVHFLKSMITALWLFDFRRHPRSAKRHGKLKYTVNLQQKYAKRKKKTNKIETCFLSKRGQAQRTVCSWGQMGHSAPTDPMLEEVALFFQSGLHLFLPPSTVEVENNFRSVNSGTVVLLWPSAEPALCL